MNFEIDTEKKEIILLGPTTLLELQQIRNFIGDGWEKYVLTQKPIEVEKWIPITTWPIYPSYPINFPNYPTYRDPYKPPYEVMCGDGTATKLKITGTLNDFVTLSVLRNGTN